MFPAFPMVLCWCVRCIGPLSHTGNKKFVLAREGRMDRPYGNRMMSLWANRCPGAIPIAGPA